MAQKFKACLVDLYDTLVHFDREAYRSKVEIMAHLCQVEPSDYERAWKSLVVESNLGLLPRTQDRVLKVLSMLGVDPDESLVEVVTLEEHRFLSIWSLLYPDTNSVLARLREQQIKVGLVTNASPSVWEVIRAHQLETLFDCIVISSEVGVRKPDVAIYQEALHRLSVRPHEAVFVGDGNDRELEGAKAVGMITICIDHHTFRVVETQQSKQQSADFTIESLKDILQVIGLD